MEQYVLRPIGQDDGLWVMDIFNYYVEHSFAAYPQEKLPLSFFDMLMASYKGYPHVAAVTTVGEVVGFGGLRAFNPMSVFRKTAEVSYFLSPAHTGQGLGSAMLGHVTKGAKEMGIECLLASISSLNAASLGFHERHGFERCGVLKRIGCKNGTDFDVVYMQKFI
jgi:phosphinothricin acetyltransferase